MTTPARRDDVHQVQLRTHRRGYLPAVTDLLLIISISIERQENPLNHFCVTSLEVITLLDENHSPFEW
jgi:hypothetical protein